MAAANAARPASPSPDSNAAMLPPHAHDNGTSLIARAEALNAFMKMQPAADQARHAAATGSAPRSPTVAAAPAVPLSADDTTSCFCFGSSRKPPPQAAPRPKREYYPDNLSVQPTPHPWDDAMEWLIVACVDFLEQHGLHERNLFAVSAVDDLVRSMSVPLGKPLPPSTDPHVAAGVIKAKIRHANEPLVAKNCLREYIEAQASDESSGGSRSSGANAEQGASPRRAAPTSFRQSNLCSTIDTMAKLHGARRAYILARFMRLLGRVSGNVEASKMNAHCLAKCVAPSMLHWDPNSGFALLMLGKITAYVMAMIEDARVFDENLCQKIDELAVRGAWQ